ncbi:MAG: DUF2099 family protein [Bacilli bacterium]|jgi:putative methanogenesis marker protein 8|nr:DUF2099 family protein [Bacilli bacterium]
MASHSGLKYILETKKGYVKEDGSFTNKESEAMLIDFNQFGFGTKAIEVYQLLGFDDQEIKNGDASFRVMLPSYESRDGIGINYYYLMGCDYKSAIIKSRRDYMFYNLQDDNNCLKYKDMLKTKVLDYYKNTEKIAKTLKIGKQEIPLYKTNDEDMQLLEGELKYYYSEMGRVYKYTVPLKNPHVEKYFDMDEQSIDYYNHFQQKGLIEYFLNRFNNEKFSWGLHFNTQILDITITNDKLTMYMDDWNNWNDDQVAKNINRVLRDFYAMKEMHITRMFGSYVILQKINDELQAVKATPVPIKYCPLMIKLLYEVGGSESEKFIEAIRKENTETQTKMMCNLINNIVIKGGYFDTSRPLNSCEANVLFGASETIASAFKNDMLDAAVIVSNNLGTIITTNNTNTQGAVKRMTGLFYTSPSENIMNEARESKIIPVFPYSANIDQITGVKQAIEKGYKKIAVTFAAQDNKLLNQLKELEKEGITIYKFALCSTGIDEKTAKTMLENADIVWSCASKYVKEYIKPNAIAQVGVKIPVHIMTRNGWELVRNHLQTMSNSEMKVQLEVGEEKPIILNQGKSLKLIRKKELYNCNDCPHPCV